MQGCWQTIHSFACDITGMLDPEAFTLLQRIATKYADANRQTLAWALLICKRRISFAIQHAISRQLISAPPFGQGRFVL